MFSHHRMWSSYTGSYIHGKICLSIHDHFAYLRNVKISHIPVPVYTQSSRTCSALIIPSNRNTAATNVATFQVKDNYSNSEISKVAYIPWTPFRVLFYASTIHYCSLMGQSGVEGRQNHQGRQGLVLFWFLWFLTWWQVAQLPLLPLYCQAVNTRYFWNVNL